MDYHINTVNQVKNQIACGERQNNSPVVENINNLIGRDGNINDNKLLGLSSVLLYNPNSDKINTLKPVEVKIINRCGGEGNFHGIVTRKIEQVGDKIIVTDISERFKVFGDPNSGTLPAKNDHTFIFSRSQLEQIEKMINQSTDLSPEQKAKQLEVINFLLYRQIPKISERQIRSELVQNFWNSVDPDAGRKAF
jgi:hypothetical protein